VAELVQHRAVLGKQQRQRQNPRETQSTHIYDKRPHRPGQSLACHAAGFLATPHTLKREPVA
jgi:hypothetical protein